MAIIKYSNTYRVAQETLLNIYPAQMVSKEEKESNDWIKANMDYFYSVAINQYARTGKKLIKNYDVVHGKLSREDFYEEPVVSSFMDDVVRSYGDNDLPLHAKNFSIMSTPLNTLQGEMSKRADNTLVKAFDEDSKAEENQFKTQYLNKYIFETAKQRIIAQLAEQGEDVEDEQVTEMTFEQIQDELSSYTSTAEKWGSRMLEYIKARFSLKELSEEGFRDLLITGREFFLIHEDKSPEGFGIKCLNPAKTWFTTTPDNKYISDPFDRKRGAFSAGTIEIMELSQILQEFDLPVEEIEELNKLGQQNYLLTGKEGPLVDGSSPTGIESINYDVYDPVVLQYRMQLESELGNGQDFMQLMLPGSEVATFGNKYIVVRAYWNSKKKIGKLTYINDEGLPENTLVDEDYKDGEHPQQISLEWGWINQWYQGVKIGPYIYHVKPFELFDYCPIIGSIFENKNGEGTSLVNILKPFQVYCNIYFSKLFESIQKDMGPVPVIPIRQIPVPKDGEHGEAIDVWMEELRNRGVVFIDDSPENTKSPSNFNQYKTLDLSWVNQMQGYYNMYAQIKNEAYEIVGISRQRQGSVQATETATATNAALTASYSQTEPWFMHHEYTMNKLYQAALDAAQYIESQKPESIIPSISGEVEHGFIKVNGADLKLKDLGVFVTSRSEDTEALRQLRMLAQPMLQNGASIYDVANLYTTKSTRALKESLKRLRDKQEEMVKQQQQLEQQQVQQQQVQFEQAQQAENLREQARIENENMNKELDRISKEKIAVITASGFGKVGTEDANDNGVPDIYETQKLANEQQKIQSDYSLKMQQLQQQQQQLLNNNTIQQQNIDLQREKIAVEREKSQNDLKIAKENKQKSDAKKKK